jgi:hypothetical protein
MRCEEGSFFSSWRARAAPLEAPTMTTFLRSDMAGFKVEERWWWAAAAAAAAAALCMRKQRGGRA